MVRSALLPALALALSFALAAGLPAQTQFQPGPDSRPQPGVPKGEVIQFRFEGSKLFPGTIRDCWIYVPAQYRAEKPACLYVNQDGIQWQAPVVFDNLIHRKEMPVTIGVFVMHGRVAARDGAAALDRFNRSFEYDGLGERYARFLAEELLPEVETKKTADGRPIRISRDPNDRAIGGSSSGAVCAFTAAWERPDLFRRVFSAIGTYVGLRGADRYPTLVRKYEPKPLRVFLQGGSGDLNIYAGDWWMANQMLERALTFSGYEVAHVWGDGGHNGQHGTAVFPDAMRWLWKEWPQPVRAGKSRNTTLGEILLPGAEWETAGKGYRSLSGLAAGPQGEVAFHDPAAGQAWKIGADGTAASLPGPAKGCAAQAYGPDGRRYAAVNGGTLLTVDAAGRSRRLGEVRHAAALAPASSGFLYVAADPGNGSGGEVWRVRPDGKADRQAAGLASATGIALSPDQTLLYVAEGRTHWVTSFQIQPDGSLAHGQRYYWLHTPDDRQESGARGMAVDRAGRLYVATKLGVQVCDQAGRVHGILPVPGGPVTDLCLGGPQGDTLYAAAGETLYRRRLGALAAHPWARPVKPAAPRL